MVIDLAIILPVYNNGATLIKLHTLLSNTLNDKGIRFHFVFVNDKSQDDSAEVLNRLEKAQNNVTVYSNKINLGQHQTILNGFNNIQANYYLVMDADLQDDPKYVAELWDQLENGVEVVFLKRFAQYQSYSKMTSSFALKKIIQLFTGMPRRCGMYFIAKDRVVDEILKNKCPYPYISIMAFMLAKQVKYIKGIRHKKETGGSGYNTMKRLKVAYRALYCVGYLKWHKRKSK